jgi:mannose-6-phosphate isomerase-like protein (cupin superfamily)
MASLVEPARATSFGAALTFETIGTDAPSRLREYDDTLLRVIDGALWVDVVGREPVCLGPGGETIIPAGAVHTLVGDGARCVYGFRASTS